MISNRENADIPMHDKIIHVLRALGYDYNTDADGMCFGFSCTLMQAAFIGNVNNYTNRLNFLINNFYTIIRNEIGLLKQELKLNELDITVDQDVENSIDEENIKILYEKLPVNIRQKINPLLWTEIQAFLFSVVFYSYFPRFENYFFPKYHFDTIKMIKEAVLKEMNIKDDIRSILPHKNNIIFSIKEKISLLNANITNQTDKQIFDNILSHCELSDDFSFSPFHPASVTQDDLFLSQAIGGSIELQKRGGFSEANTIINAFNQQDLSDLLLLLTNQIEKNPQFDAVMAIVISQKNHAMILIANYTAQLKSYFICGNIDSNIDCLEPLDASQFIMEAFQDTNDLEETEIELALSFYCLTPKLSAVNQFLNNWLSCPETKECFSYINANLAVNEKNKEKCLTLAILQKQTQIAVNLIENNKYLASYRNEGDELTPLYYACSTGNFTVIKSLLDNNANQNIANYPINIPICWAAHRGLYHVVKLLLNYEIEVKYVKQALFLSAENNHFDITMLLIKYAAHQNISDTTINCRFFTMKSSNKKLSFLNEVDNFNNSLLHYAVMHRNQYIISFLLSQQIDVNQKNKLGHTPLHYAVLYNQTDLAEKLLQVGANAVSLNAGPSLAYIAARNDNASMLYLLMQYGANINEPCQISYSDLIDSIKSEAGKKLLLEKKSNFEKNTNEKCKTLWVRPLEIATLMEHHQINNYFSHAESQLGKKRKI